MPEKDLLCCIQPPPNCPSRLMHRRTMRNAPQFLLKILQMHSRQCASEYLHTCPQYCGCQQEAHSILDFSGQTFFEGSAMMILYSVQGRGGGWGRKGIVKFLRKPNLIVEKELIPSDNTIYEKHKRDIS